MAWVKIDDGATEHPKLVDLSDAGMALWIRALCYCARRRNDGFVPVGALRILSRAKVATKVADELVTAKLWDVHEGGYRVHDYHDYQPSKASLEPGGGAPSEAKREAARAAGTRSGEVRRAHAAARVANEKGTVVEPVVKLNRTKGTVVQPPDPVPDPPPGSRSDPNPTHSAGVGEQFDSAKANGSAPAASPPPVEPDQRDVDQPERAAMLAALRASPLLRAVADTTALGLDAALGGLADQVEGMRAFGGKRLDVYLVAIGEALRDLTAEAVGNGPPTWAVAAKKVTTYCTNARPIRASPGNSRSSTSTLQQPAPPGASTWTIGEEM